MIANIVNGFSELMHFSSFLYMNFGIFVGIVFGAMPGMTVMLAIVLFLPITYALPPIESFMFLLGIYAAGSYGGSISAIMIKTPGTPHAAATVLDGFPLAEKGYAKKALNIALYASTFGGLVSAFTLLFLTPPFAQLALAFGPPEYFVLCAFGLTLIAGVSGESLLKGVISACIGLLVAIVGIDELSGAARFAFGSNHLLSGLDMVVVVVGLFAIAEALLKADASKAESTRKIELNRMNQGEGVTVKDFKKMLPALIRSTLIGLVIGALPGTGASMAAFMSYDQAKRNSKTPEEFGRGSIEGIAAPECGNNAVTGTTLVPLLTLGIPGDCVVALLIGAFMMNDLVPGPNLFKEHATTVYAIMIGLIFINVFMFLQGKFFAKYFAKIALVPPEILNPVVIILCLAGSFSMNNTVVDVHVSVIIGILSYYFIRFGYSTVPILLGIVLGPLTEMNFRRALIMSDGSLSIFLTRPISLGVIVVIVATMVLVRRKTRGVSERPGRAAA